MNALIGLLGLSGIFRLFGPAWHITKKDLRASHALVIVGVLLGVVETLLRTWWPPLTMSLDVESTDLVNAVKEVLPLVRSLAGALLVAQLVHADPLADEQGFWLTRPISRGALFVSKVMTIALAIVAPAVLGQVAPMIAFGVPPLDVTRLLSEYLLYQATGLIVVFAAAALTPNVRSLVAWGAALGIVWALVLMLIASISSPLALSGPEWTPPSSAGQVMLAFGLMAAGCGVAAWHQYRTRRTGRSALIAAATTAIVVGLPYVFEPAGLKVRTTLMEDPAVPLGAGMRFKDGPRSVVMWPLGDRAGQCGVMVRVTQAQGAFQPSDRPAWLSYHFVYRPTERPLSFTWFALPDRDREFAAEQFLVVDTEARERFQIFYRYAVVGPMYTTDDPRTTELKSVSCRDIDVVIRH